MLSGNRGEWSEIYVFLKLLAEGRIDAADANLNVLPSVYFPIVKILRAESQEKRREYLIDGDIKIIDGSSGINLLSLPKSHFVEQSRQLFNQIAKLEGRAFQIPEIEEFLASIDIGSLATPSSEKSDIHLVVHDMRIAMDHELGFSIKSMLGGNSSLFNAGSGTNFIYEVLPTGEAPIDLNRINGITEQPKIARRIELINKLGCELSFRRLQSDIFQLNLKLIDGDLPDILAALLLLKYSRSGDASLLLLLRDIEQINPLRYDLSKGHPFYEYKLKAFLTDVALGMTPSRTWLGVYDATGGIIIVKPDGNLVCYHIYNRAEFQDYLLSHTKLEQASTSRWHFGEVYEEDGAYYLKLNLQIRFTD